jgi:hypothetical protein
LRAEPSAPYPSKDGRGEKDKKRKKDHRDQNNKKILHPYRGPKEQQPERRDIEPQRAFPVYPKEGEADEYDKKKCARKTSIPMKLSSHHHRAFYT